MREVEKSVEERVSEEEFVPLICVVIWFTTTTAIFCDAISARNAAVLANDLVRDL
jgi:hypothetical protein